ncbi:MAG: sn-glycerol-3-phosphate ABC transporter ATP-binding protein UgpC [Bacilli bacterium]|jgi:multiple sugar transport system ATP-binding protein|nr:sn-glycerol-3-phosphate ABC transporter ATP-binding protein UgpC [Bacilli bacterium]
MAGLELQHLKKVYDDGTVAVQDTDISIKDGEFIVLVGPSGCGKSTTLRMIAGLEDISEGKLLIDGKDVTNVAAKDRDIAMVFQNYALYSNMTIYENMAFSLVLRKADPELIHTKVMEAAKILGLVDQLNKKPRELSGGQRQRVAMGRAIVRNPKVFLFDEPLSNLDAKLRASMRREIKLLHHQLGTTMIYVTHDQTEALTLADRIVVMSMGKVQQIGTPYEIYHDPANAFVGYFIGNPPFDFFEGTIQNGNFVGKEGVNLELNPEQKKTIQGYEGKTLLLGIRPENFTEGGTMDFHVDLVEHLGQNSLIHGRLSDNKAVLKLAGWKRYNQGDTIKVSPREDKICFFDIDSGKRIRG